MSKQVMMLILPKRIWIYDLLLCCIGRILGLSIVHTDELHPTTSQSSCLFNWFLHQPVSFITIVPVNSWFSIFFIETENCIITFKYLHWLHSHSVGLKRCICCIDCLVICHGHFFYKKKRRKKKKLGTTNCPSKDCMDCNTSKNT